MFRFSLIFSFLFMSFKTSFASYPPPGSRKYIINEKKGLSIEKVSPSSKASENKKEKIYQDPIFDKQKFMKVLNQEREALMKRSKLVDEASLVQMAPVHIKGRSADPRVLFETKKLSVPIADKGLKVKNLDRQALESEDLKFSRFNEW